MKIVAKPIEMIAWFSEDGIPRPLKFKIKEKAEYKVIKIDHIIERTNTKIAGIQALVYKCQSLINGTEKRYELKYEVEKCKWILYKI